MPAIRPRRRCSCRDRRPVAPSPLADLPIDSTLSKPNDNASVANPQIAARLAPDRLLPSRAAHEATTPRYIDATTGLQPCDLKSNLPAARRHLGRQRTS